LFDCAAVPEQLCRLSGFNQPTGVNKMNKESKLIEISEKANKAYQDIGTMRAALVVVIEYAVGLEERLERLEADRLSQSIHTPDSLWNTPIE
jgi:hypothetical protein